MNQIVYPLIAFAVCLAVMFGYCVVQIYRNIRDIHRSNSESNGNKHR